MQYAMVVGGVCIVGYLLAGLIQVWWIVLGISLALLLAALSVMRYLTKKQ